MIILKNVAEGFEWANSFLSFRVPSSVRARKCIFLNRWHLCGRTEPYPDSVFLFMTCFSKSEGARCLSLIYSHLCHLFLITFPK